MDAEATDIEGTLRCRPNHLLVDGESAALLSG
jgi:hypothetical protein